MRIKDQPESQGKIDEFGNGHQYKRLTSGQVGEELKWVVRLHHMYNSLSCYLSKLF